MKLVCAWCEREGLSGDLGETEPLEDQRVSHSICDRHIKYMEDLDSMEVEG